MTTLEQRRALALRIAKTVGRDPASLVAALRSRLAFHGHHNQESHGNWADDEILGDRKRGVPLDKSSGISSPRAAVVAEKHLMAITEADYRDMSHDERDKVSKLARDIKPYSPLHSRAISKKFDEFDQKLANEDRNNDGGISGDV